MDEVVVVDSYGNSNGGLEMTVYVLVNNNMVVLSQTTAISGLKVSQYIVF